MNSILIEFLLVFLLLTVALNLWLTLRLIRIVRPPRRATVRTVALNQTLPSFSAQRLLDNRTFDSQQLRGAPSVLLFLSARCGDCRTQLPKLVHMLPAMERAGVRLFVMTMDAPADARQLLADTPLWAHALTTDKATRGRLNPDSATPFYIFVDHLGVTQASHMIGDENWQVFEAQMLETSVNSSGMVATAER